MLRQRSVQYNEKFNDVLFQEKKPVFGFDFFFPSELVLNVYPELICVLTFP